MGDKLLKLYPEPSLECEAKGLYLAHRLDQRGDTERPYVYGDFVQSLDGRIAIADVNVESRVPKSLGSRTDFRLLLELHAQADCIITHGGYMRAIAEGRLDDILQIGSKLGSEDLIAWRAAQGLSPQPAVCIASAGLDFPIPESLRRHGQRVLVATGNSADASSVRKWEHEGVEVFRAGAGAAVEGKPLAMALGERGYRSLFLLAGPRMLETTLRDGMLARLYLTMTHRLLGGERFHTLIDGPEMGESGRLHLTSLYLQLGSKEAVGQFFALFEPAKPS